MNPKNVIRIITLQTAPFEQSTKSPRFFGFVRKYRYRILSIGQQHFETHIAFARENAGSIPCCRQHLAMRQVNQPARLQRHIVETLQAEIARCGFASPHSLAVRSSSETLFLFSGLKSPHLGDTRSRKLKRHLSLADNVAVVARNRDKENEATRLQTKERRMG